MSQTAKYKQLNVHRYKYTTRTNFSINLNPISKCSLANHVKIVMRYCIRASKNVSFLNSCNLHLANLELNDEHHLASEFCTSMKWQPNRKKAYEAFTQQTMTIWKISEWQKSMKNVKIAIFTIFAKYLSFNMVPMAIELMLQTKPSMTC